VRGAPMLGPIRNGAAIRQLMRRMLRHSCGQLQHTVALTAQGATVYPKRLAVFIWTDYAQVIDALRQTADGRE